MSATTRTHTDAATNDSIAPGALLPPLELPPAPRVTRATAAALTRPKAPAVALLILGIVLALGPIVAGMYAKVAAGQQMVDQFAPHMTDDALARYQADLGILHRGALALDAVYRQQQVAAGRFPQLDAYRAQSAAIEQRASDLLHRVAATQADYREVAKIGGFDRIPFLITACGIVAIYGACVLLVGRRSRIKPAIVLVVVASAAVALYPFASNLPKGAQAGQRMLHALAPVMTRSQVRQLQSDFVILVGAVGELDTSFHAVPRSPAADADLGAMDSSWPAVSSDFASLVGAINDNLSNYHALNDLDAITRSAGFEGLGAFPWLLVAVGAATGALAVSAWPRRRREDTR
jgi:hypothetical protein